MVIIRIDFGFVFFVMQVSWIFERSDTERTNIAVFHPSFGVNYPTSPVAGRVRFISDPATLEDPSIQISNVKMTDEGRYICEYATYPSGNEQGVSSLVMLGEYEFVWGGGKETTATNQ